MQRDPNVLGAGVLDHVLKRLLCDPQHVLVAAEVRRKLVVDLELDVVLPNTTDDLDVLAQRAAEAVALEIRGAQLEDQRAHLVQCLARETGKLGHLHVRLGRVALEEHLCRLRAEEQPEEDVGEVAAVYGQLGQHH